MALPPIIVRSYSYASTSSLSSFIISPFLSIKDKFSTAEPLSKTSALPESFSIKRFFGNPSLVVRFSINLFFKRYPNAHSRTSTPGLSISQVSMSSLARETSFILNSLIFCPTSTIVVDAFRTRAIFIPTSSVDSEYSLLLIAISIFIITLANKM